MSVSKELHDNIGNVTTITDGVNSDMTANPQAASTYRYTGPHPHAVTEVETASGTEVYVYDDNGNMTSGAGRTLTYDYDNMPSTIVKSGVTSSFLYDYKGKRVKKTVGSSTTVYIGKLYECTGGTCTKYIFAGAKRIANKTGETVLYYHTDHLGSSNVITYQDGTKAEEIKYHPFGAIRTDTQGPNVKHKYTGQEFDPETGLYYYGARYYDPALGRFITPDTIVQDYTDPQSLNRYSYARNNPLLYIDPTGNQNDSFNSDMGDLTFDDIGAAADASFNSMNQWAADYRTSLENSFGTQTEAANITYSFSHVAIIPWAYGSVNNDVTYNYGMYYEVRSGGTRSWRNNNPGNLRPSGSSSEFGSIGQAGGFAVFPDYATGFNALTSLLQTGSYQPLTVNQAIERFAPPSENNTSNYQSFVQTQTGLGPSATLNSLSNQQINSVASTIQRMEGWSQGTISLFWLYRGP